MVTVSPVTTELEARLTSVLSWMVMSALAFAPDPSPSASSLAVSISVNSVTLAPTVTFLPLRRAFVPISVIVVAGAAAV